MQIELDFWKSLSDSDLAACLALRPKHEQVAILQRLLSGASEFEDDVQRKRDRRSKAAEVFIPPVADVARRNACLADPVLFLKTYGAAKFVYPFCEHHLAMVDAIVRRAKTGGDQAIAAPRGDGKTQIATWMIAYLLLTELVRFPVVIAATRKHAQKIFRQVKWILGDSEPLASDFPEISACVQELHGAPQRAAKQHVNGQRTNIIWTQDEIGLPSVPGSNYGGRYCTYFGLDSAIRGVHYNGVRPDYALIDDPETREVAKSEEQNLSVEEMIDSDVAGLCSPDSQMVRVVLTTVQNRRCYSFRVTDPTIKPAFSGKRYGVLSKWPDNRELWEEYVSLREKDKAAGDNDGKTATAFYLANREAMDAGAVVANEHRFNHKLDSDGSLVEVSALQSFFNKIADWGMARVLAELQNDPEEEETDQTLGLTSGLVASRISGLEQNKLPQIEGVQITVGLDLGKYWSHWVKVAWFGNATGVIIDYGIIETPGVQVNSPESAIEIALLKALTQWRTDVMALNPPNFALVDSGDYSGVVYEFVRQSQGVFAASKGLGRSQFHMGTANDTRRHFENCWAGKLPGERVWLYHVDAEHWKQWTQERFMTPTFSDQQQFNDGTLSLYASEDRKRHHSFSHHIVAEERREIFVEGKGLVRKWVQVSKNNHWLDATAYACCAAGVLGVRLIPRMQPGAIQAAAAPRVRKPVQPQNNRFRQRPGGWLGGLKRGQ